MNIGANCENKTPNKINKHPNKLFISKIWSNKIQAAIVAKTPSKEKIIADGAGDIFFCAYICKTNARPPDKTPAYKIWNFSFRILDQIKSSKINPIINDKEATIKVWIAPIVNGRL